MFLAAHGFNDYRAAFQMFGAYAAGSGYTVIAYDQAGFGERADGGRWPGADQMTFEFRRELARLNETYPDIPIFALGVSMGASVVLLGATADISTGDGLPNSVEIHLDGIILPAPAVWGDSQLNPIYRAVLWTVAQVAPGWRLTGRGLSIQPTDNIDALRQMSLDPLVLKDSRVDGLLGLVRLMDATRDVGSKLPVPVFVLIGEKDELVPSTSIESFAMSIDRDRCWLARYPNGWHMLLRDIEAEVVWHDILAWADDRSIPSGQGGPCEPNLTSIPGS
ncbi:MAG: alpha/beta fold hydrolase [Pseudomonadota bacterium]